MTRWKQRVPFIAQLETTECGAACLCMILAHYGHWARLGELREECHVSRDGVSAASLVDAAKGRGLQAGAVLADMAELDKLCYPCVIHMDMAHFVVLNALPGEWADITDPAVGHVKIKRQELAKRFTGVAILLVPDDAFRRQRRQSTSGLRISKHLAGSGPYLLCLLMATAILQGIGMATPFLNRYLMDWVIPSGDVRGVLVATAVGFGVFLFLIGVAVFRDLVTCEMRTRLDMGMISDLFDKLMRLPMNYFLQRQEGALAQRIQMISRVRELLSEKVVTMLFDVLTAVTYFAILAVYTKIGALFALGYIGMYVLAARLFLRRIAALQQSIVAAQAAAFGTVMETHHALEAVKASGTESQTFDRWYGTAVKEVKADILMQNFQGNCQAYDLIIKQVFWVGVIASSGWGLCAGVLTVGQFATVMVVAMTIMQSVGALATALMAFGEVRGLLASIGDVLEAKPERAGGDILEGMDGAISLRDVTFAYNKGIAPVLEGVSIDIHSGEMIGVVGPSGSGKSTLAKLLVGLHLPADGRVEIDGVDLARIDLEWFRQNVGFVMQDTFLFDDTIAFNVALFEVPDLVRVKRACWIAGFDEHVAGLPLGYGTRIGENGRSLSGGQRQRINIARAIYRDPAILILDEATSALDLPTEQLVHERLASLRCTRVIIAHRLETVRACDRIVIMEGGAIQDSGSFDALLARNETFRSMCLSAGIATNGERS